MCLNIEIINQFIRIIMETEALDNLSRGERFEMLKKMCKSRTINVYHYLGYGGCAVLDPGIQDVLWAKAI